MEYPKEIIINLQREEVKSRWKIPTILNIGRKVLFPINTLSGQPGAEGVYNIQKNYFEEVDKNTTKWVSYNEFKTIWKEK